MLTAVKTRAVANEPAATAGLPSAIRPVTLRAAADQALRGRWAGLRCYKRNKCQVGIAVRFLEGLGCEYVEDVTAGHLLQLRDWHLQAGLAIATLNVRLACLSTLGVHVTYYPPPRQRKWFLSAEEEIRFNAMQFLPPLPAFVMWTVATGLRVEESLALRWHDVDFKEGTVVVSGTKTDMSQAILPMSQEAHATLKDHALGTTVRPSDLVFDISYRKLRVRWEGARARLGLGDIPTATLKSLRRSFARRAHLRGMPVDVLRQYLRHGSLKTTQAYLWLVGGYSQDEMRRWL